MPQERTCHYNATMRLAILITLLVFAGCSDARYQAVDDAHTSGRITSADRRRLTNELNEKRLAELDASRRASQQYPPEHRPFTLPVPPLHDDHGLTDPRLR